MRLVKVAKDPALESIKNNCHKFQFMYAKISWYGLVRRTNTLLEPYAITELIWRDHNDQIYPVFRLFLNLLNLGVWAFNIRPIYAQIPQN